MQHKRGYGAAAIIFNVARSIVISFLLTAICESAAVPLTATLSSIKTLPTVLTGETASVAFAVAVSWFCSERPCSAFADSINSTVLHVLEHVKEP